MEDLTQTQEPTETPLQPEAYKVFTDKEGLKNNVKPV